MKKLLLFSVAALAFCACSNDAVVSENKPTYEPKEMSFAPLNKVNTRAAVQGTAFPDQSMEVKAYQTQPSATGYFDKTTFAKKGSYWGATPAKYWPLSPAKLNFFAVSGAGVTDSHITIADLLASASVAYTSANSYGPTTQSDIMYAFGRDAVTKNGNALTFPTKVDMVFKHALALINFQIKAGNDASTAIKIKKIELNGARYTGTLAITNTNAATESDTWSAKVDWTPDAVQNNVVVPNIGNTDTPVALTTSYVPENTTSSYPASLMIIPKQQKSESPENYGFTTFTITYTLDNKDYTYVYAPAGYTESTPNLTVVQAGYKYTYQITMTVHEILINPSVQNWADGGSTNINLPQS